jgi:hypothetical protein
MENTKKQQTAVEWLANQILDNWNDINAGAKNIMEFLEQAKEMEKEQIKDAYDYHRCIGNFENGEQYYNETYGDK